MLPSSNTIRPDQEKWHDVLFVPPPPERSVRETEWTDVIREISEANKVLDKAEGD